MKQVLILLQINVAVGNVLLGEKMVFKNKKQKKYFIYFVLIAPIIAKILEWILQLVSGMVQQLVQSRGWIALLMQIFFIIAMSLGTYLLLFYLIKIKKTTHNFAFVVGIAYFLKEIYNLIFVVGHFSLPVLIALTLEPIFMYTIIGVFLPKLFFKELRGSRR